MWITRSRCRQIPTSGSAAGLVSADLLRANVCSPWHVLLSQIAPLLFVKLPRIWSTFRLRGHHMTPPIQTDVGASLLHNECCIQLLAAWPPPFFFRFFFALRQGLQVSNMPKTDSFYELSASVWFSLSPGGGMT
ncbi:unnamed protein product [Symbiodinium natans]|uniref:Uncharacterized protein n=1 Tax=Symbiodinium natans TaxID=878477 RepID=A0A812L3G4_9DINO|nr:unnamed protein product [Symbiodinium natans]